MKTLNHVLLSRALQGSAIWTALAPVRRVCAGVATLVARLTRDEGAAERDRLAETALANSFVGRHLAEAMSWLQRAWTTSLTRGWIMRIAVPAETSGGPSRLRYGGVVVLAAALTALALRPAATRPAPMTWIVPVVAALIAVVVIALAKHDAQRGIR